MKTYIIAAIGLVAIVAAVGLVSAGYGPGTGEERLNKNFVDADDDGICDNWIDGNGDGMNDLQPMDGTGHQYRYGAGSMNGQGNGPHDGTGYRFRNGDCIHEE